MLKFRWVIVCVILPCFLFGQIRVDSRLVEVHVSVRDSNGKPVTTLRAEDFRILEDGREQALTVFEPASARLTVALLIDTTASAAPDLPYVKNAIGRLLSTLDADDSVGLYTFATSLTQLSDFTTDRKKTLNAVLQTRANGNTALFDSLVQLSRSLSRVSGKKAILLFTDGDDNQSVLSLDKALEETRRVGVPIYAMLYGRAIEESNLLRRLESISKSTGATSFRVRQPSDLPAVFQRVAQDMQELYMLGYQFGGDPRKDWHTLTVEVPNQRKLNITAREGYWQ